MVHGTTNFRLISSQPIKCQCCPHVENSQLICCANQLTGFYRRATLTLKGLSTSDLKMKRAPLNKRLDIILTYMQYAYMYIAYV